MEYYTGNPSKIEKGKIMLTIFFLNKSLDLLERHPEADHQYTIVRKKANAISDHVIKSYIAA